jgi:predicted aspartyl protease
MARRRRREPAIGTVYTDCTIANPAEAGALRGRRPLLVDTGSGAPRVAARRLERLGIDREKKDVAFVLANGRQITRSVGFAILRVGEHFTIDEVVFAEPGDLQLLGARTLEGLNLTVDPARRRLVGAGPLPAAAAA